MSVQDKEFTYLELRMSESAVASFGVTVKTIIKEILASDPPCTLGKALAAICEASTSVKLGKAMDWVIPGSAYHEAAQRLYSECMAREDFTRFLQIAEWQLEDGTAKVSNMQTQSTGSLDMMDVVAGWKAGYVGLAHLRLLENIRIIHQAKVSMGMGDRDYKNSTLICQSSGGGKSRTADEASEELTFIPFNTRDPYESEQGAYPPPDDCIREYLKKGDVHRYLCFFLALFQEVELVVKSIFLPDNKATGLKDFARQWRLHICTPQHRIGLYQDVTVKATAAHKERMDPLIADKDIMANMLEDTNKALKALLRTMDQCHKEELGENDLRLVLYFDEAQVLAREWPKDSSRPTTKSNYELLLQVINEFQNENILFLFLSTQSRLRDLAPSAALAVSARYIKQVNKMPAPLTEMPFDCIEGKVNQKPLTYAEICHFPFLAQFGRPLWQSLLSSVNRATQSLPEPNTSAEQLHSSVSVPSLVLPSVKSSSPSSSSFPASVSLPSSFPAAKIIVCSDIHAWRILRLARAKLIHDRDLNKLYTSHPMTALIAVVDVRLMLAYRPQAHDILEYLVASHMRLVYSVSLSRAYMYSGYPSEPILAEAAAEQIAEWRQQGHSPALDALKHALLNELLERGQIGELIARLLLMLAYDAVVERKYGRNDPLRFSRGVPAVEFLAELLPEAEVTKVLDSKPDNSTKNQTLRNALAGGIVRFTHWVKAGDDYAATTPQGMFAAFVRCFAVIGKTNAKEIDLMIPIWLGGSMPSVTQVNDGTMVFMAVQVRNRKYSTNSSIHHANINYFSKESEERPYVTLRMQLGLEKAEVTVGKHPKRRHRQKYHRYSIFIDGCSPLAYRAITESDEEAWKQLIRASELFADHPRQNPASLEGLRNYKPAWTEEGPSYRWIDLA